MKLISMTEFVLEQGGASVESDLFYFLCSNYAQFLKQPLTLGMFVPCYLRDGIWIPYTKDTLVNTIELFNEFEQAKERVLFEYIKAFEMFDKSYMENQTIEDLLKDDYDYILTQSAIKQIGL